MEQVRFVRFFLCSTFFYSFLQRPSPCDPRRRSRRTFHCEVQAFAFLPQTPGDQRYLPRPESGQYQKLFSCLTQPQGRVADAKQPASRHTMKHMALPSMPGITGPQVQWEHRQRSSFLTDGEGEVWAHNVYIAAELIPTLQPRDD